MKTASLGMIATAALLAACASPPPTWQRPGTSPEATSAALAACRGAADRSARERFDTEQRVLQDRASGASGLLGSPGLGSPLPRERLASDRREHLSATIDACMTARGFVSVTPGS